MFLMFYQFHEAEFFFGSLGIKPSFLSLAVFLKKKAEIKNGIPIGSNGRGRVDFRLSPCTEYIKFPLG